MSHEWLYDVDWEVVEAMMTLVQYQHLTQREVCLKKSLRKEFEVNLITKKSNIQFLLLCL